MTLACDPGEELLFFAGNTWTILAEFTLDGAPVDLTGQTIKVLLKNSDSDLDSAAAFEYDFAVPSGPDATNGKAAIIVPSTSTPNVVPAEYFMKVTTVNPGSPPIVQSYGYTKVRVSR